MRELVKIRQLYNYFNTNKFWIIGLLYVCAIVKDFIWYSVFGVNILNFITIQDSFISFLSHTMILVVLILNYLLFQILFSNGQREFYKQVIKILIIVVTSIFYFFLFKKFLSLIALLIFLVAIHSFYTERKYSQVLAFLLIFAITFSTLEPLSQAFIIKRNNSKSQRISNHSSWSETNMDFYSFKYENTVIDTKLEKYFLIGNNKEYFFIFDKELNQTLIIPKSKCENIRAEFKLFNY